jgi:hypothetical protein
MARYARTGPALNGIATTNAWRALGGNGGGSNGSVGGLSALAQRLRRRAIVGGFPLAIGAMNRAKLGPVSADISLEELRRAGLRAIGEVAARLDLGDAHVIFGHTHRAGPLPGDDAREWRGRGGARLVNSGSWIYDVGFVSRPGDSPYWPGTCVLVEDSGPPVLKRLLLERSHAELEPALV